MAESVSFGNGISGISRVSTTQTHSGYPESKSNFQPSGEKVVDHTWRALDMGRNLGSREQRFATNISNQNNYSSPEEHQRFTEEAKKFLSSFIQQQPDDSVNAKVMKDALTVIEKAKSDSDYLMMCRNVLIAS